MNTTILSSGTINTTMLTSETSSITIFDYINYVFLPVSVLLGVVGNSLTVLVMRTDRFSGSPFSCLLIVLALSDLVALLSQPFNKAFFIELIGQDIRAIHDITCKLYIVIRRTSKMMSSWMVVGLCLERFIAVWFPMKAKYLISKRLVLTFIISILVIIVSFNGAWSYASRVLDGQCNPDVYDHSDSNERLKFGLMLQMGTAIYSMVPIVILIFLTTLIVVKLFKHQRWRRSLNSRPSSDNEGRITAMLICIVIAYVILILPITIIHNVAYQKHVHAYSEKSYKFSSFKEVAQWMEQLNYCLNFFLYVMTSKQFRQLLCNIVFKNSRVQ
ncbi:growth hormone secretagogue receptor type 1-like [Saccostrea cucullata]|uniref:growth hormone secretagogue receptor type 1-like n=1 Tax=Saccostrea cuccullata TaxID=36930 RepID=UPI002ED67536